MQTFEERVSNELADIKEMVRQLVAREQVKEHYDTEELAKVVGKTSFTVRRWCREGRINARKLDYGHYVISHNELLRLRREGLLPDYQKGMVTVGVR